MMNIKHLLFLSLFLTAQLYTQDTSKKWEACRTISSHKEDRYGFKSVAFCKNDELAGAFSDEVKIWDSQGTIKSFPVTNAERRLPMAYHKNSNTIIAGSSENSLVVIPLDKQQASSEPLNQAPRRQYLAAIGQLKINNRRNLLAAAGWRWNNRTVCNMLFFNMQTHQWTNVQSDFSHILDIEFAPQGTNFALATGGPVDVWDIETQAKLASLPYSAIAAYCVANSISFLSDNSLVLGCRDNTIRLWDIRTNKLETLLHLTESFRESGAKVLANPNGDDIAINSANEHRNPLHTISLFSLAARSTLAIYPHDRPITAMAWDEAGARLAVATEDNAIALITQAENLASYIED
jgi:WD40 repeat protein